MTDEMSSEEWDLIFEAELEYIDIMNKLIDKSFEEKRNSKLANVKKIQPTLFDQTKQHKKKQKVLASAA